MNLMNSRIPISDRKSCLWRILLQNRHNKTNSKESGTGDTEMMPAYSSTKASDSMYD